MATTKFFQINLCRILIKFISIQMILNNTGQVFDDSKWFLNLVPDSYLHFYYTCVILFLLTGIIDKIYMRHYTLNG